MKGPMIFEMKFLSFPACALLHSTGPYTVYEFRVQAATVVGAGDFSDPREFRTAPGGIILLYV